MSSLSRFDPFKYLLQDFIDSLRIYGSSKSKKGKEKISIISIIMIFLLPLFLAIILLFFRIFLTSAVVNALFISLSIFASLLFNALLLVYDFSSKKPMSSKNDDVNSLILRLIKDTYADISFSILISILAIVFLLIYTLLQGHFIYFQYISFVIYYFLFIFISTLSMDLKKVYILIGKNFGK
jgi:hypothetical protein